MLFGLTGRTAAELRRRFAMPYRVGVGSGRAGSEARGVTWVKVTGSADGDGWYPGVVSLDLAGDWSDLTLAVKVQAADGTTALVEDDRYLCTRCGDDADGPRFKCEPPPSLSVTSGESSLSSNYSITADSTLQDTGLSVTLPSAGTYLVCYSARGQCESNSAGGIMQVILRNVTAGAYVATDPAPYFAHTTAVGSQFLGLGAASVHLVLTVAGSTQLNLYAQRTGGTFTGSNLIHAGSVLNWVKIG